MLQIFLLTRSKLLSVYRQLSTHVIHIDGGLGSQIMQFALYRRLQYEGKRAVLNTSYYDAQEGRDQGSLVIAREWELNAFGHERATFPHSSESRLTDKDFARLYFDVYKRLLNDEEFLRNQFTPQESKLDEISDILKLNYEELRQTTVVHIRQGDFLKVASFLLKEEYYLDAISLVEEISKVKKSRLVFVSDEAIEPNRWPKLFQGIEQISKEREVFNLIGMDSLAIHDLMRHCGALVCSNSNFSFSAAIFRKGMISIYPSKFYNGQTAALNPIYKLPFGIELHVT